jgi:hypothetical protein
MLARKPFSGPKKNAAAEAAAFEVEQVLELETQCQLKLALAVSEV